MEPAESARVDVADCGIDIVDEVVARDGVEEVSRVDRVDVEVDDCTPMVVIAEGVPKRYQMLLMTPSITWSGRFKCRQASLKLVV